MSRAVTKEKERTRKKEERVRKWNENKFVVRGRYVQKNLILMLANGLFSFFFAPI